ncbi:MAG: hypothetical protein ACE5JU_16680 [Candidatus Binatia bacterium]
MGRYFKELDACIANLRRFQASEALEPSQREAFVRAVADLKKFGRMPKPDKHRVLRAIRVIAETLWEAYSRRG